MFACRLLILPAASGDKCSAAVARRRAGGSCWCAGFAHPRENEIAVLGSELSTPSYQGPARRFDRGSGSTARMIVLSSCGQRRTAPQERDEFMSPIRAARAAPRERSSPRNGQPETVPYVYRQQRGNTYAARIARRNAQAAGQLPAPVAAPGEDIPSRGSQPVPFADPGVLGGSSWPGFGELGTPVEDQETGTR